MGEMVSQMSRRRERESGPWLAAALLSRSEVVRATLSLCLFADLRWIGQREKEEAPEHNFVIQCTIWLTERQLRTIIQCTMKMFTYTFYAYACLLYTWPLQSCVYARLANDVNLAVFFCFLCKLRQKFARKILTSSARFDIMSVACATVQTACVGMKKEASIVSRVITDRVD